MLRGLRLHSRSFPDTSSCPNPSIIHALGTNSRWLTFFIPNIFFFFSFFAVWNREKEREHQGREREKAERERNERERIEHERNERNERDRNIEKEREQQQQRDRELITTTTTTTKERIQQNGHRSTGLDAEVVERAKQRREEEEKREFDRKKSCSEKTPGIGTKNAEKKFRT